jgi:hypothetical protein
MILNKKVVVRYIDQTRGRGVVATRAFTADEIVFSEKPLVSQRDLVESMQSSIQSCHHCMKSTLSPIQLGPFGALPLPPCAEFVACPSCAHDSLYAAKFCSKNCQDLAWNAYHRSLCTGLRAGEPVIDCTTHPLKPVLDLCRYESQFRRHPLHPASHCSIIERTVKLTLF